MIEMYLIICNSKESNLSLILSTFILLFLIEFLYFKNNLVVVKEFWILLFELLDKTFNIFSSYILHMKVNTNDHLTVNLIFDIFPIKVGTILCIQLCIGNAN